MTDNWRDLVHATINELIRLDCISHGSTTAWRIDHDPETTGRPSDSDMRRARTVRHASGGNRPPGEAHPPQDELRDRLAAAIDRKDRDAVDQVRRDAIEIRDAIQKSPVVECVPEKPEERVARILQPVYVDIEPIEVARRENVTLREVVEARQAVELDPLNARPWREDEGRDERIGRLHAEGLTVRAIASVTGTPRETVRRVIKRAA